jgi:hypothetical protein
MTPLRFKTIILGALTAWELDHLVTFNETGLSCEIKVKRGFSVAVVFQKESFGNIWKISKSGEKERIHPSIGAALKGLSLTLCPYRLIGRVLFA